MKKVQYEMNVEINNIGRMFEGIGGISSNGTTKLLMDYPKAQQKDIIDLLFKPNYGASLHHLKLEIGSDANTSSGTEPSHMRCKKDFNIKRGAGLWLAKHAKKVNEKLKLGALRWGLPKWITNDEKKIIFYKNYLAGAFKEYGITFDYLGADENEGAFDRHWTVEVLRKELDKSGYSNLKIIAADSENDWFIADLVENDKELKDALHAMGIHYTFKSPEGAKKSGLPLWLSEEIAPMHIGFAEGCLETAERIIRMYVDGKMVKCELHPLFEGNYETTLFAYKGILTATWPWSGHYRIELGLWVIAHFTQFIQPGWVYLNDGCFWNDNFGAVTLMDPDNRDISIVAINRSGETKGIKLKLSGNNKHSLLHVYKSETKKQFIKQDDIFLKNGEVFIELDKESIYSLTSTCGQKKRKPREDIPSDTEFELPFYENYERYALGSQPLFTSDQAGAFEIYKSGKGNVLRQAINNGLKPIDWCRRKTPQPYTLLGSTEWMNYRISIKAMLEEKEGYVLIGGRANLSPKSEEVAQCYNLILYYNGEWKLRRGETALDSGIYCDVKAGQWHLMELKFKEDSVMAKIDGIVMSKVFDCTIPSGQLVIGGGYNFAQFKDLNILPSDENLSVSCKRFDDNLGDIKYSKGFTHERASYLTYNRSLTKADKEGSTMEFEFYGTSISVIGKKGTNCGKASVYFDEEFIKEIDTYSEYDTYRQAIFSRFGLDEGKHNIKIVILGKCSEESNGTHVYIDAIEVAN